MLSVHCPVHGKPAPAADADDEAMRIALDTHLPSRVTAARIRAYGDSRIAAERDKAPPTAHAAPADADDEPMRIALDVFSLASNARPLAAAIRAFGQAERERSLREVRAALLSAPTATVRNDVDNLIRALLGGGGR